MKKTALREDWKRTSPFIDADGDVIHLGLGKLFFMTSDQLMQGNLFIELPGRKSHSASLLKRNSLPFSGLTNHEEPPFFSVMVFLLAFSLFAGPLGWWRFVAKRKQPLTYLFYVPFLSLGTIVIIVGMDAVQSGFTPIVHCKGFELIDQTVQKRVTLSRFDAFCPFKLGQTLIGNTLEQPYFHRKTDFGFSSFGLQGITSTPRDGDLYFGGDVLPIREKAGFAFERITRERRRLNITRVDDRVVVENHLGIPLEDLLVRHEGTYVRIERLGDGERKAGTPLEKKAALRELDEKNRGLINNQLIRGEVSNRLLDTFKSGRNCYFAFRKQELDDLIWIRSARFADSYPPYFSSSILWGIY